MQCSMRKALHDLEANVLRYGGLIKQLIALLKNAREDGGLVKAQSEKLDRLIAQSELILTGRDDALYGLTTEERREVADYLEHNMAPFLAALERPETGACIITNLRRSCE